MNEDVSVSPIEKMLLFQPAMLVFRGVTALQLFKLSFPIIIMMKLLRNWISTSWFKKSGMQLKNSIFTFHTLEVTSVLSLQTSGSRNLKVFSWLCEVHEKTASLLCSMIIFLVKQTWKQRSFFAWLNIMRGPSLLTMCGFLPKNTTYTICTYFSVISSVYYITAILQIWIAHLWVPKSRWKALWEKDSHLDVPPYHGWIALSMIAPWGKMAASDQWLGELTSRGMSTQEKNEIEDTYSYELHLNVGSICATKNLPRGNILFMTVNLKKPAPWLNTQDTRKL